MPTVSITFLHLDPKGEDCEDEMELDITISGGSPGRYYGPPEDCYPAEDPDVEFYDENQLDQEKCGVCGRDYHPEEKLRIRADLEKALKDFDVGQYMADEAESAAEAAAEARYEDMRDRNYDDRF